MRFRIRPESGVVRVLFVRDSQPQQEPDLENKMLTTVKQNIQRLTNYHLDSGVPLSGGASTTDQSFNDTPVRAKLGCSRQAARPVYLYKKAIEEPETVGTFVDPQSLSLEERISYYRSELAKLVPAESFRAEVLIRVYEHLLTQSLRQQEA